MTLPLFPELGVIAEGKKPRLAGWWSKKPGWYKDEVKRALWRYTDHQFLAHQCRHKGTTIRGCNGWSHKDWLL